MVRLRVTLAHRPGGTFSRSAQVRLGLFQALPRSPSPRKAVRGGRRPDEAVRRSYCYSVTTHHNTLRGFELLRHTLAR